MVMMAIMVVKGPTGEGRNVVEVVGMAALVSREVIKFSLYLNKKTTNYHDLFASVNYNQ